MLIRETQQLSKRSDLPAATVVKSERMYLSERAQIYDWLRSFFLEGPNPELFDRLELLHLAQASYLQAERTLETDLISSLVELKDSAGNFVRSGNLTPLQTEFTRLFIGPGKAPAYPYESLYRSPKGMLMTEVTSEVRNFYLEQGLLMQQLYSVPEDHLGIELEFIYYLKLKMLEKPEDIPALNIIQESFLREHVLSWIDHFTEDVLANTQEPFFRHLARFLRSFLHWDSVLLTA